MLEFAELCRDRGELRRYAHISTAYVAGTHRGEFSEEQLDVGQGFRNPYEQSKFEAEQLVHAHDRPAADPDLPAQHRGRRAVDRLDRVVQRAVHAAEGVRARNTARPARAALGARGRGARSTMSRMPSSSCPTTRCAGTGTYHLVAGRKGHERRPPDRAVRAARRTARAGGDPARRVQAAWCTRCSPARARAGAAACSARASSSRTSRWTCPTGTTNARRDLEPDGIEVPPIESYFGRLVEYAERARVGPRAGLTRGGSGGLL